MADVEFEDAIAAPSSHFKQPADVLASGLSKSQQRELLQRWEHELRQMQAACDENMPDESGDDGNAATLQAVSESLTRLGDDYPEHADKL